MRPRGFIVRLAVAQIQARVSGVTVRGTAGTCGKRARVRQYAFHRSTIGTDDEVIAAQIERLDRQRIKWQKMAMRFSRRWSLVQKRGDYFMVAEPGRKLLLVKKKSEYIRGGKKVRNRLDYPLTTCKRDKPMMNYCYSHILNF